MICLTDYFKLRKYIGFKEGASFGVLECYIDSIIQDTILIRIEVFYRM